MIFTLVVRWLLCLLPSQEKKGNVHVTCFFPHEKAFPKASVEQFLLTSYWLPVGHVISTSSVLGWDRYAVDRHQPAVSTETVTKLLGHLPESWKWSLPGPTSSLTLHISVGFSLFFFFFTKIQSDSIHTSGLFSFSSVCLCRPACLCCKCTALLFALNQPHCLCSFSPAFALFRQTLFRGHFIFNALNYTAFI